MKYKLFLILFFFVLSEGNSQTRDTLLPSKNLETISYKQFIVPSSLILSGFLLKNTNINLTFQKDIRNFFGSNFQTKTDNFIPFIPIAQVYGGKYLGYKPKNDVQHQTINIAIANLITQGTIEVMKHSFQEERPDKSDNYSFPSGHTAFAFTNATLLFYEFKDSNIWYASSGFLFATVTGILRIANNKHFSSDVLTGAGIGLGVGLTVSYWSPFKSMTFWKNKTHTFIYPQIGKNYGIGLILQQ